MSNDLKTQVREYARLVEADDEPVTVDEVRDRLDRRDETIVSPRRVGRTGILSRGAWPAVVAAAVVLILFGALVWLFPSDSPPPADSFPDPIDRELGYYTTSAVPDGYVLQDMEVLAFGGNRILYLNDVGARWTPGDGGLLISLPFPFAGALPEDPNELLDGIVESVAGSSRVVVGGRSGVVSETVYDDGPVTTSLVRLAVVDEQGGVFEITATGMSQQDILAVAEGVERVPVHEFMGLVSDLDWDLKVPDTHTAFEYEVPRLIEGLANDVDVVLGSDVFSRSSLARSLDEDSPVITTDDGSIVEPEEGPEVSGGATLYLEVPDDEVESALRALEHENARPSPQVRDRFIDGYLGEIRGDGVISEDPLAIQAPFGPAPQFDTEDLGDELPLMPATSLDVLPEWAVEGDVVREALPSTEDRPIIVIGTARQPGSDLEPVTVVLWFSEMPGVNIGLATGEGMSTGGGSYPLARYGIGGQSTTQTEGSPDVFGEFSYSVPLETSVVQIVTETGSYWQRPAGGYGAISWGDTIDRPTSIIAFDASGDELGQWEVPQD